MQNTAGLPIQGGIITNGFGAVCSLQNDNKNNWTLQSKHDECCFNPAKIMKRRLLPCGNYVL